MRVLRKLVFILAIKPEVTVNQKKTVNHETTIIRERNHTWKPAPRRRAAPNESATSGTPILANVSSAISAPTPCLPGPPSVQKSHARQRGRADILFARLIVRRETEDAYVKSNKQAVIFYGINVLGSRLPVVRFVAAMGIRGELRRTTGAGTLNQHGYYDWFLIYFRIREHN